MSKSVKNLKQMLLEGAGVGCGVAVQGASRDVELCLGPTRVQQPCAGKERELLIMKVFLFKWYCTTWTPSATSGVSLSPCAEEGSLSTDFSAGTYVWPALLPRVGEKKGLTDVFLNRESASFVQIIQYFFSLKWFTLVCFKLFLSYLAKVQVAHLRQG